MTKTSDPTACALDDAVVADLTAALKVAALPTQTRHRMRTRVLASVRQSGTEVTRSNEGEWTPRLPGITIKTLHRDEQNAVQMSLWRLAPGVRVPPHSHTKDEECLVLEGCVVLDGIEYHAGDFLFTRTGVDHTEITAPEGALLLIRGGLAAGSATPAA